MGLASQVARLIVREHLFRPIRGKLLSIGRQSIYLTPHQAIALVQSELGIPLNVRPTDLEADKETHGSRGRGLISDRAFFSLFSDATYHSLDQSNYENADIVFDLCSAAPPSELENQFDFIIDGSTLDNVFDPAAALRNLVRLARVGGRLVHLNRASRRHNVYVAFALAWFYDYYSVNQFDDCQVYLGQWDGDQFNSRWDFYHYRPLREHSGVLGYFGQDSWYYPWRDAHTIVIAEKGKQSTWDKNPIQFEYRADTTRIVVEERLEISPQDPIEMPENPYIKAAVRFAGTQRPLVIKLHEKCQLPPDRLHYAPEIVYCGSIDAVSD